MKNKIKAKLLVFEIIPSDPLKQDFLGIDLTTFLGLCNFGNTSTMRVIFF